MACITRYHFESNIITILVWGQKTMIHFKYIQIQDVFFCPRTKKYNKSRNMFDHFSRIQKSSETLKMLSCNDFCVRTLLWIRSKRWLRRFMWIKCLPLCWDLADAAKVSKMERLPHSLLDTCPNYVEQEYIKVFFHDAKNWGHAQ